MKTKAQQIQTVIFSKSRSPAGVNGGDGWTASSARAWLRAHDFNAPEADETENSLRFRQFDPDQCAPGSFVTLTENMPLGVSLVSCQTGMSADEERAMETRVHQAGNRNARARIAAGDVNQSGDWSFSASDGNALLGSGGDDWANYGRWHLGEDTSAEPETKARFKYPFGKGGTVYRSAVAAIRQRSSAQDEGDIFAAAGSLMEMLDARQESGADGGRMIRAYSKFTVKNVDDERRIIEGIATSPAVDRVGDVVEPDGAKFELPLPLLWQHNAGEPIGHVISAKVSKTGIAIVAKFARIDESGRLRDRLEEAWQSVKTGLVRGLSIGFRSIEHAFMEGERPGIRFIKWDWLELSAVTIPANVEATIQTIKAADLAPIGRGPVSINPPGASGKSLRSAKVKTIKERINDLEATRAAKIAELEGIQTKANSEGRTKDTAEKESFDTFMDEVKALDAELKDLHEMDRMNLEKAAPVKPAAGTDPEEAGKARAPHGSVRVETTKLEPGVRFARMAMSIARAKAANVGMTPEQYYRAEPRWMETAPEIALALKTAVNAGDSTTSGWASEIAYAQNIATEFIEFLRPRTIVGRVTGWRNVPFNIRVGSQSAGSTGYWVGQGKPIPMSRLTTSSVSLGIAKVAGMVSIDKELARLSTPSAELMVRNDLTAECQKVLDLSLIDPNQGGQTNIQPASLTYGLTPVTPSGTNYAAFVADVKSLFSTAIAAQLDISLATWIISPTTALALSLMVTSLGNPQFPGLTINGGTLMGLPVVVTTQATIAGSPQFGNIMVLVFPGEVFLADDGVATVEASDQVSIQMDDAPTNQSTATSTPTTLVSMFQTESIAIKAVRYINWAKARAQACAFIQAAAYA